MASQLKVLKTRSKTRTVADQRSKKVQQYVNQHLEKTRKQVKAFDLIASLIGLLAFLMFFFLAAAIVDAWILPLGVAGRFIGLGLLIVGLVAFFGYFILPLVMRRINPDYVAKMIEESKPTFRNSLLNYLALRKQPEKTRRAVYDAVARQAAKDLSAVPEDSTVDRSNLIHVGFVLVGILAAGIVYGLVSPKNPLPTIVRILSPMSKIAQPSIVKIYDVVPGDAQVFFGEHLEIIANVRGRHDAAEVKVVFSTLDGEIVNRAVAMVPAQTPKQYRTKLTTDGVGIHQALTYHVVAGDGNSPDYKVLVRPNPTISIKSVVLTPPSYTKLDERILEGQDDVQVLEGSQIRLNTVANLPIKLAYIELLDSITDRNTGNSNDYRIVQTIDMTSDDRSAYGGFAATLNSKRDKQLFTHFRVRFRSVDGDRNENANVYPIRIAPDLAPEVVIINPIQKEIALPINQKLAVDIQATDLDFEISSIDLHLDHQGTRLLDRDLKLKTTPGNQRVTSRQLIDPVALNFKVGDRAVFFATAADNRTSLFGNQLDPNISRTENYTLVITDAREQITEPEQPEPQQESADQQENQSKQNDAEDDNEQDRSSDDGDGSGEKSDQDKPTDDSEERNEEGNETGSDEGNDEGSEAGNDEGSDEDPENAQSGDSSQEDQSQSNEQQGNEGNQGNSSDTQDGSEGQSQGQNQTDQGQTGDGESEHSESGQPDEDGNMENGQGSNQGQQDSSVDEGDQESLGSDATDGDKFERLQELLNRKEDDRQAEDKGPQNQGKRGDDQQDQSEEGEGQQSQGNQAEGEGQNEKDEDQQGQNEEGEGQQSQGNEGEGEGQDEKGEGQQGQSEEGEGQQSQGNEGEGEGQDEKGEGQQGQSEEGEGQQSQGNEGEGGQPGESPQGESQPGESAGQKGTGKSSEGQRSPGQSSADSNDEAGDAGTDGSSANTDLGKEEANVDFAKKATDMVLEKLENQASDPDPKLLEQMNWTKEEMQAFVKRWREMERKAKRGNRADRERYQNALRSLGLLKNQGQSRKVAGERDDLYELLEDGAVNKPPPHLIDSFNAFLRERSRARNRQQ